MKTEIMIAVLGIICIGALAAAFVLWAKLDEQKKLTQEERNRRWDEISRAVNLENDLRLCSEFYQREETKNYALGNQYKLLKIERDELQNKLSALLCPHNDHVWKDGVCVKCGRMQGDD